MERIVKQGIIFDMDGTLWDSAANVVLECGDRKKQTDGQASDRDRYQGRHGKDDGCDRGRTLPGCGGETEKRTSRGVL